MQLNLPPALRRRFVSASIRQVQIFSKDSKRLCLTLYASLSSLVLLLLILPFLPLVHHTSPVRLVRLTSLPPARLTLSLSVARLTLQEVLIVSA